MTTQQVATPHWTRRHAQSWGRHPGSPQRNMHWIAWVDQVGARFFWCGRAVGYPVPCVLRARFCDPTSHTLKEPDQRNQRELQLTSTFRRIKNAVSSWPEPTPAELRPTHLYAGPSAYARGFMGLWLKQKAIPAPIMPFRGRTPYALHHHLSPLPRTIASSTRIACPTLLLPARIRVQL